MEFLAPIMLAGIAAAAIPIAIHLRGRRRARVVPFAAMDFLLGSDRKVARKLRLRELLVLAARVLVCVAIALAFAKPLTSCEAKGPAVERGPQAVVLIVDDSLGTRHGPAGERLFDRIVDHGRSILSQLGPEADVALIRTSEGAAQAGDFTRDHLGLENALAEMEPTHRPPDVTRALSRAASLLESAEHERRTAFLISPLLSSGFREKVRWTAGGAALEVIPVAGGESLENTAVTDLELEPGRGAGERAIRVTAELRHSGAEPRRDAELELEVDGETVARSILTIEPGETTTHSFLTSLPDDQLTARVAISLAPDALAADDSRHLVAEVQQTVRALLVNGDPSSIRYEDELFYLKTALRPGDRGDSGVKVEATPVDGLDDAPLDEFDVVVLANVPALSEPRVSRLADWVESGGGLLITAGDNVDPIDYEPAMAPLLPQRPQSVRDLTYGADEDRGEGALALGELDVDHPIFGAISADRASFEGARFSKVLLLGPTADDGERRVVARYETGAPALLEAERGRGRVLLFTSSADRAWNDLAIFPAYPPLMQAIVRYLGRKQERSDRHAVTVGQSAEVRLDPGEVRIAVEHPGGRRDILEAETASDGRRLRAGDIDAPGFYRIYAAERDGELERAPSRDFAAQLDPRGSDLARNTVESIAGAPTANRARTHERRVELWHAIAAALLGFLLVEAILVWRSS